MADGLVLAAEWVLPVSSPPIRDGVVVTEGARIAWVGPRRELPARYFQAPMRAFPRALLLPGWVNAHSHLQLTAALGMVPGSADRFADWVRTLLRLQAAWPPEILRQSIRAGLDLLATTGTTTVAHVATLPELEPFLEHPMRSIVFHEAIGFPEQRAAALVEQAEEWHQGATALIADAVRREEVDSRHITLGLAPHAPYSVSGGAIHGLRDLARRLLAPFSIHLAETRAELEFLASGEGQLRGLLEERGAWDPSWVPPGVSPVGYLEELGVMSGPSPGLAVHCNYLSDEDVTRIAGSSLVPVWCPGSHRFFGHRRHPAPRILAAGGEIALGTDSLASNAGLNMLREVRLAAEEFPDLDRGLWVRAGTLSAARGLGLGAEVGSLEAGKRADLQVLAGVPEETTDPLSALFEANLRVRMVMVDGNEVKIR